MGGSASPGEIGARVLGTVKKFDFDVGLGEVEDSAGQRWVFHCTEIADGSRDIESGSEVTFVVRGGAPGQWEAYDLLHR